MRIPFNKPRLVGGEINNISSACLSSRLSGSGAFTARCELALTRLCSVHQSMLTHSCTAALEIAAMVIGIQPGDEVIMPSYTFTSTANAFALRGAVPVFVDIREDTLNIDERLVESAVTGKTKAIVPVHYAGVGCEMDRLMEIAANHRLWVVEDAAQGIGARYKGKPLGGIGDLGALSFHETKNVTSGEGGALLFGSGRFTEEAEVVRDKGTDRSKFFRGEVDKYTWVGLGSSYLPGELTAAFLETQLSSVEAITRQRLAIWNRYHEAFKPLEASGRLRLPLVPHHCSHNGHIYYLLMDGERDRDKMITALASAGIQAVRHYVPLHSSPAGVRYGKVTCGIGVTDRVAACLVRLPMWVGLEEVQDQVIEAVISAA